MLRFIRVYMQEETKEYPMETHLFHLAYHGPIKGRARQRKSQTMEEPDKGRARQRKSLTKEEPDK